METGERASLDGGEEVGWRRRLEKQGRVVVDGGVGEFDDGLSVWLVLVAQVEWNGFRNCKLAIQPRRRPTGRQTAR
jgi:hypothetical protein